MLKLNLKKHLTATSVQVEGERATWHQVQLTGRRDQQAGDKKKRRKEKGDEEEEEVSCVIEIVKIRTWGRMGGGGVNVW